MAGGRRPTTGRTAGRCRASVQFDRATQDKRDVGTLDRFLAEQVVPTFYDRDPDGLPRSCLARIRASMRTLPSAFCAPMLDDYIERIYVPTRAHT